MLLWTITVCVYLNSWTIYFSNVFVVCTYVSGGLIIFLSITQNGGQNLNLSYCIRVIQNMYFSYRQSCHAMDSYVWILSIWPIRGMLEVTSSVAATVYCSSPGVPPYTYCLPLFTLHFRQSRKRNHPCAGLWVTLAVVAGPKVHHKQSKYLTSYWALGTNVR